ncbi:hypothetical protein [Mycolicibacterium fortuitum]|uniref:hypothetical protein n=1 Tax=Mycolicibacterium fortuitum TaxID=1766 RepID=UPI0007EA3CDA|nr:hypothetical protein [Mycolicibacterium fortuitum]MCA4751899.1 hypothetical protein [Mycolicibacterium fortuitum]MDG5774351.1 hypothetical protein [Mycolicibacterium fortuitum]MDG5784076.1 hypothetical protein [Mycolicibacterium fortuitum]OBA99995.1 hypothetical protein A5668_26970 [Mycolicibacterium fortuitum]OBB46268.1 hypothetical protein A5754_07650 [Mycolicibacterium fortuitum]
MAASLDVAARLDEGQAAVDTIAEYVWACHLLGFDHPDLTRYRYQVHDWYSAEEGLDLRVLDVESASLAAAATVAEEELALQDKNFQNLVEAWHGTGARASTDFLARHAASSAQVAAGVRSAAAVLTRLRDSLWAAVEAKVSAALQIEGRQGGQRGSWLAAARTVSTGLGDRSAASELIDTQVKPFVVNDVAGDWLAAMRSTTRAVADAYGQALAGLRAEALPVFGIPGELGPAAPVPLPVAAGTTAASAAAPSWQPSPAAMPAAMSTAPSQIPPPAPAAEPLAAVAEPVGSAAPAPTLPAGAAPGMAGGGMPGLGGLPDVGSGLAGAGQQLADLFGGLLGSSADGLPDRIGDLPSGEGGDVDPDDGPQQEADDEDDPDVEDTADEDGSEDTVEDGADEDEPVDSAEGELTEPQSDSPPVDEASPDPQKLEVTDPAPTVPGPAADPLAAPTGGTPCEIAADELPQVGE